MNEALSAKWSELRGLEVVSIAMNPITLPEEDQERIKQLQSAAALRDPNMAGATIAMAQADAMRTAAGNEGGAMNGFIGMGMAMNAGGSAANLFAMGNQEGQQPPQANAPAAPAAPSANAWFCPKCGQQSNGNFCTNCGTAKPAGVAKCANCGYEPADQNNLPKFCPECGKPFNG